jgi:hypothetical protein
MNSLRSCLASLLPTSLWRALHTNVWSRSSFKTSPMPWLDSVRSDSKGMQNQAAVQRAPVLLTYWPQIPAFVGIDLSLWPSARTGGGSGFALLR